MPTYFGSAATVVTFILKNDWNLKYDLDSFNIEMFASISVQICGQIIFLNRSDKTAL